MPEAGALSRAERTALLRLQWAYLAPIPFMTGDPMSDDYSSDLRLITPPAAEPITLAQAKAFLRIEHTADDVAVSSAIAAARHFAETYLRTALLPQTWELVVACPTHTRITLPVGPARAVTSVTCINAAGDSQVMNGAHYRVSADGFSVLFDQVPLQARVVIRYSAYSYADVAAVPALLIQGMLHHIAVMVEQRDGVVGLPVQAMHCYQPYRRVAV